MTATDRSARPGATYLLPIVRADEPVDAELTDYLREIAQRCELIVVDGSAPRAFAAADTAWSALGVHIAPDPRIRAANGKAHGVLTGVERAHQERIVIADDDVRYDAETLERGIRALDGADLVRPQNYFERAPWHARWDTARTLVNRAIGTDFPGTLLVRRSTLRRTGGYDGDVLFENLELIRTVEAAGGRVTSPLDLYVARRAPSAKHFWSQRPRQAYDELARPWRFCASLGVLPLVGAAIVRKNYAAVAVAALAATALAELGRRRAHGTRVFPASASVFAPIWLVERSACSWLALGARLRGGCRYRGKRFERAATPSRVLRARLAEHSRG